jgi:hypothetical protein
MVDICKRSNKRLDIIWKIRYLLPRLCIEKLYKSFVRSLLDSSDVIDDNCSNTAGIKLMFVTLVTYIPTWRTPKMVN